jgi:hypothetical protein
MIDPSLLENPNLAMLEIAVRALGDLCESLVFVGGCATGLLVTTVRAHHIRATEDVDVVTKVATISGYHDIEARLSARGFKHQFRKPSLARRIPRKVLFHRAAVEIGSFDCHVAVDSVPGKGGVCERTHVDGPGGTGLGNVQLASANTHAELEPSRDLTRIGELTRVCV